MAGKVGKDGQSGGAEAGDDKSETGKDTPDVDLSNPEKEMEDSSAKSMAFQSAMMALSLKNSMFSAATSFIMEMHKAMKDFAKDAASAQGKAH